MDSCIGCTIAQGIPSYGTNKFSMMMWRNTFIDHKDVKIWLKSIFLRLPFQRGLRLHVHVYLTVPGKQMAFAIHCLQQSHRKARTEWKIWTMTRERWGVNLLERQRMGQVKRHIKPSFIFLIQENHAVDHLYKGEWFAEFFMFSFDMVWEHVERKKVKVEVFLNC